MTEPATRPEPGTKLPWDIESSDDWSTIVSGDAFIADFAGSVSTVNARYIVYAANKLPELEADRARLVAMLKQLADAVHIDGDLGGDIGRCYEGFTDDYPCRQAVARAEARALLVELGEEVPDA